jgi:hypothetical protein
LRYLRLFLLLAIACAGSSVVSAQTCAAPVLGMFNICTPFHEASVANPVPVSAAARPPQGAITSLQLWVDGVKQMNSTTGTLSGSLTNVTLSPGKHKFTFIMTSTQSGVSRQWNSIVYVNVQ